METIAQLQMSEHKARSITQTIKQFNQKLFGFVRNKVKTKEDA